MSIPLRFGYRFDLVLAWGCIALSLITVLGCDSKVPATYPVQGRVSFDDGTVVEQGTVEFRLDAGSDRIVARGKIGTDGTFSMSTFQPGDGALPGTHQVIVQQLIVAEGFAKHQHGPRVPINYAEYDKSGLTAEVKAAKTNTVELKLRRRQ